MERHAKFLWMKDLLEHLHHCHEQWETAEIRTEGHWYTAMQRDLAELRSLCDSLRQRPMNAAA